MQDIIRAGVLWGYCQLTRFLGHDPALLLDEVGLREQDLDNPDKYISRPAAVTLLERTAERLDCSDFGLRLGQVQDVNVLGALAFAIRNAPDLRGAVMTMVRHVHCFAPLMMVAMEPGETANEERVVFHHLSNDRGDAVQHTERAISLFCRLDDHLTGHQLHATRVMFNHAPASPSDVYLEYLGVKPEFGAPVTAVSMERRALALPLKTANPQLQAIVERYLELNTPAPGPDIGRRVHQAIAQIMRHGNATIEDVADMLNMHPRTLQRRLMLEGITFERARDDVRRQLAQIYLANDVVPLAHVAHLLGYANQSVLTRSCLRWFGKTPLAVRHQVAGHGR